MSVNKVQLANGETIIDISDSTVTPETLAEGVTAHDASGQKITGKMVPGGSKTVQTDWNQTDDTAPDFLKNKPFGDFPGDTLSWDGNPEGKVIIGDFLCKVSDVVPTLDDFANGATLKTLIGDIPVTLDELVVVAEGILIYGDGFFAIVSVAGAGFEGMVFPEAGIYMSIDIGGYLPSLVIPGYTGFIKNVSIDKKYLGNVFVQYDKFIRLTSGGADPTKTFFLWVNDRGEVQVTAEN